METVRDINDFKKFLELNKGKIYENSVKASDISIDDEWMQDNQWDDIYEQERERKMEKYNIGDVWWTHFPFQDIDEDKHRPAIVIDEDTIAVLAMMVTSKEKEYPYCIEISDWKEAGLHTQSWARIDRIIKMDEWRMDKKIGELTSKDLNKFLQLIVEIQNETFHEFSLVAIVNPTGEYLQIYDEDWGCWLFPYFKNVDPNKENVDRKISDILKIATVTSYVTNAVHCKYSVRDGVYKRYKHKLYRCQLSNIPEHMIMKEFELDGKKYAWKSIKELENDCNAMDKNDDIIAFVKLKCK